MSSNFGIRQTFRTQSISRKMARNKSNRLNENETNVQELDNKEENLFENGNNFFVNNVLNRQSTNLGSSVRISQVSQVSQKSQSQSQSSSSQSNHKNPARREKMISARINTMKNYSKAVTKSADHM